MNYPKITSRWVPVTIAVAVEKLDHRREF